MAFIDDFLADIQDPEQKKAVQGLPAGVIQAFEKRAALAADANTKLSRLDEAEKALANFQEVNKGWVSFGKQWKETYGDKVDLATKIKMDREQAAELARLKAEVQKLAPEAARAAALAAQAEGDAVDPAKISESVLEKIKGEYLSKSEVDAIVKRAVSESKQAVDFGTVPGVVNLIEKTVRAHNEFGLDISANDMALAAQRYPGRADAFDLAYNDLTKNAREALATKNAQEAEAKRLSDLAEAERRGAEKARREFETSHIQGEDAGGSFLGTVPLNSPKAEQKIDPRTYDPSAGNLAAAAVKHYHELEATGFKGLQ